MRKVAAEDMLGAELNAEIDRKDSEHRNEEGARQGSARIVDFTAGTERDFHAFESEQREDKTTAEARDRCRWGCVTDGSWGSEGDEAEDQ